MPHDVIMPQMGESIAEGTVTTWLKKVGESVARDEPLFEISTDKVDAEIPSPVAGTLLEIKVDPGTTVPIDTVVAVIGEASETTQREPQTRETAPAAPPASPAAEPPPPAASKGNGSTPIPTVEERRRTKSSPVVRKIAAAHGIDISQISGSGISGRVTKRDILGFIETGAPAPTPQSPSGVTAMTATTTAMTAPSTAPTVGAQAEEIPPAYRPHMYDGDYVEDLSVMRQKIADHMVWSRRISAHVQTVWEVDFTHVDELRKKYKAAWEEKHGVKLTFTSFVMKATIDALNAFPVINASLEDQRVIYHRNVNLGLAVALDWGLIVPVIHGANELNLLGLTRRANDLASRARDKKLKPDEVTRGTFTITNPGVFGNLFGIPIINQPQVAILGMGGIEKRPVVIDDMIGIRTRAYVSLSFDHRLVDGAVADQFMGKFKQGLQEFDESELS